jgi:hypothetical protein
MSDSNKKSLPSLASLSQARQTSTSNDNNSLAQLKQKIQKPTSSLALLASASASTKKPLSSLQTLAQRANPTTSKSSLTSLAHKSSTASSSSLTHLASRQTTSEKKGSLASLASKSSPSQTKPPTISLTPVASKPITEAVLEPEKDQELEEEELFINPLCAKPSAAAQFLFKPQPERVFNAQDVFQKATKKPSCIHVFEFDQPSPDDIVIAAQSQRGGKKA